MEQTRRPRPDVKYVYVENPGVERRNAFLDFLTTLFCLRLIFAR